MGITRPDTQGRFSKSGITNFREHEKDRTSLKSEMEIENFDYDWKQNRSRIPEMTYNFKRIERYNHAKPPRFLVRFWTLFVSF